jgi:hypothetical protein
MPQLSLTCPHCRTEKIGFSPRGAVPYRAGTNITIMFMQCEGCGGGIVLAIEGQPTNVTTWMQGAAGSPGHILSAWPELLEPKCPADVPDNVRKAFLSGLANLGRPDGANAAAIMFRRTVELATRTLKPDAPRGDNLKKRIAGLSDNLATPAMKEWATHIRLDANDAAHEEDEFSELDAKTLHTFAEMFLTYAFTLPEMLKRATADETPPPHIKFKRRES